MKVAEEDLKSEVLHIILETCYSRKKKDKYMKRCVPLEPAAENVCNQSSVPPPVYSSTTNFEAMTADMIAKISVHTTLLKPIIKS